MSSGRASAKTSEITNHPPPQRQPPQPVRVICGEGQATLTAGQWFARLAVLVAQRTAEGRRRSWRDDAVIGLGAMRPGLQLDEG